jgi:hypothetical protein
LLLLLSHPLYLSPDQIPRFALHLDRVSLVRVVELQQVLDPTKIRQGPPQQLQGARLLLLPLTLLLALLSLLLTLLWLLIALRHTFPPSLSQLGRSA